jgi:phage terminase Nu1 subunit (DNA packaging protein)
LEGENMDNEKQVCTPQAGKLLNRMALSDLKGVSLGMVDGWVCQGLPHYRHGRGILLDLEQVDEWLRENDLAHLAGAAEDADEPEEPENGIEEDLEEAGAEDEE